MNTYDSPVSTYNVTLVKPTRYPELAPQIPVGNLIASTTYPAGSLLGSVTATPGQYGLYASGHSDGTQVPTKILQFDVTTDASGNIYMGQQVPGENGQVLTDVPTYGGGYFDPAKIPNIDANAITVMGAKFMYGSLTSAPAEFHF